MRNPQFARKAELAMVRLNAANTARDGSGTIATLITGRIKPVPVTISGNVLSIADWSQVSDLEWIKEFIGDVVTLISGTAPGGAALNTEYRIGKLKYTVSTDTATFELIDPTTNTFIPLSTVGSNVVVAFNVGTRLERIIFSSSQSTPAANSAMVCRVFQRDSVGGPWRFFREIEFPAKTASNTVSGQSVELLLPTGYVLRGGWSLGVAQSVNAGAQDNVDVHAIGAIF